MRGVLAALAWVGFARTPSVSAIRPALAAGGAPAGKQHSARPRANRIGGVAGLRRG
jgi:hypothetical protein